MATILSSVMASVMNTMATIFSAIASVVRTKLPSPATVFSTCASIMASIMAVKSIFTATVPPHVQRYNFSLVKSRYGAPSSTMSVIIEDKDNANTRNSFFDDAMEYFGTKTRARGGRKIRVTREKRDRTLSFFLSQDELVSDEFEGIKLEYRFGKYDNADPMKTTGQEFVEITFDEAHKEFVLDKYLPYIENTAALMRNENRMAMMYANSTNNRWEKSRMIHPSTFDTMALSAEARSFLIQDLDRFVSRKDFYKKVGRAWKRGYLLYGPPGTGKTSLVAAIANHLNFDIYDLQLTAGFDDATLRKTLLGVGNSSILLLEDIDRSLQLQIDAKVRGGLSLAGVLNCVDGIWSSCGEERIIIFTTNNKDAIDPALLRPGRMDVHLHMGHCCFEGFKKLASNYLSLETTSEHPLFPEVERLIKGDVLTPAQVAEEMMKAGDPDLAMKTLVDVLKEQSVVERTADNDLGLETTSEGDGLTPAQVAETGDPDLVMKTLVDVLKEQIVKGITDEVTF